MRLPPFKARRGDVEGHEGAVLLDLLMCFSSPQCWKLELQKEKLLYKIFDQYLETCLTEAIEAENEGSRS